jgi:F-type H+-transporting ATPase subunit a
MASSVLHIKDAYYFEVPRFLWPANHGSKNDFPDVWVRLDPEFQDWEAERLHDGLAQLGTVPEWPKLQKQYHAWKGHHQNTGKPLDRMLESSRDAAKAAFESWRKADKERSDVEFAEYLQNHPTADHWFVELMAVEGNLAKWNDIKTEAGSLTEYRQLGKEHEWSEDKIQAYNARLSGKVLIPQPPGAVLRNLYEPESGFCVSKFLVIQLVVALIMLLVFSWLGRKLAAGGAPKGRLWNMLEVVLIYLRDNVARPAIGSKDGDRFVPLLWTVFMFVLGCNLFGMIPWMGTPTGSFGVTAALAAVTFSCSILSGMRRFGVIGFFANQIPSMTLPFVMSIFIKPLLLVLELLGLCIKHAVLAIRLLANMVAGHLVLLGIMGLAFGATGAALFVDQPGWLWGGTAFVAVIASTLFSCLELFVAFLQAYIFTFLSALFIGAAIHHH